MFLLVAHFEAPDARSSAAAVELLATQPDCRRLTWARSTERAGAYVLVAEFGSPAAYRRALSPFDVRTTVIPWLSTARVTDSGVNEALLVARDGILERLEPIVPEPGR